MSKPFDSAPESSNFPAVRSAGGANVQPLARPSQLAPVLTGLVLAFACGQAPAQIEPLDNPVVRNPIHRNDTPDTAPVLPDPRNSDTRPTLPAAPPDPDDPRVMIPEPDPSRDAVLATPTQPSTSSPTTAPSPAFRRAAP